MNMVTYRQPVVVCRRGEYLVAHRWPLWWKLLPVLVVLLMLGVSYAAWYAKPLAEAWFEARWQQRQVHTAGPAELTIPEQSELEDQLTHWVETRATAKVTPVFARMVVRQTFSASAKNGVDPFLMLALMYVESGFNYTARSSAGALGLTQVIPLWHKDKVKSAVTLFDPKVNIDVGAQVLAEYQRWHNNDTRRALLQYNGSLHIPGAGYAKKVVGVRGKLMRYLEENTTVNS
jgi:hypothetical protein